MVLVPCPWCGSRNVSEFHYLGEPKKRPDVATATPEEWRGYLYLHRNACDWIRENWYHRAGCRRYFAIERHTLTNEVRALPAAATAAVDTPPSSQTPPPLIGGADV